MGSLYVPPQRLFPYHVPTCILVKLFMQVQFSHLVQLDTQAQYIPLGTLKHHPARLRRDQSRDAKVQKAVLTFRYGNEFERELDK